MTDCCFRLLEATVMLPGNFF